MLNLVLDKHQAFAEMHRVLRSGGHFCVSDVVYRGTMPEAVRRSAELYAGCVAGAMEQQAYLDALAVAGFSNVRIVKEHTIAVPEGALTTEQHTALREAAGAIVSVTVYGERV